LLYINYVNEKNKLNQGFFMAKSSAESKFVTGSKQTKTPKPKSLTPKTKSTKSGERMLYPLSY
jgi:hypothetical protein